MLKHVLEGNRLTRIKQVTVLFNKICLEHPIRIDLTKICEDVHLINLAWILAVCRKGYNSFGQIDPRDYFLSGMIDGIRVDIMNRLQSSGRLHKLNATYYSEPDFATDSYQLKLSYKLPLDIIIAILNEEPFNRYLVKDLGEKEVHAIPSFASVNLSVTNNVIQVASSTSKSTTVLYDHKNITNNHVPPCAQPTVEPTKEKSKPPFASTSPFRDDAISSVVINLLLPELFPDKTKVMSGYEKNRLKCKCFEALKSALEKNGCTVTYNEYAKKDSCSIKGKDRDGDTFHTTYSAFRKRFDSLFEAYLSSESK
jgi:hypothetical protein